jgi:hypothetical protein
MKAHSCVAICFLAVVCSSCVALAQTYHLDVALEGPWILYEEQHFTNKNKQDVAVLIAIAPTGATAPTMSHRDKIHHHIPQLSTGDGYYVPGPGIYCFKFDDECAPAGAKSLTLGTGYPPVGKPLELYYHDSTQTAATGWPWQTKSNGHVALILPMPDFYSNDGVWPMKFRATHKSINDPPTETGLKSIGLQLHYSKGPGWLRLFTCNPGASAVGDCTNPAKDKKGNPIAVINTGTLRLQMRAPDTTDACDHHVRFAYHQMYGIVGSQYTKDYSYIEPAQNVKPDGLTGTFEDATHHECFDHDDQDTIQTAVAVTPDAAAQANNVAQSMLNVGLLESADKGLSNLAAKYEGLEPAKNALHDALVGASQLGNFPRISEVRQIGALLNDSIGDIERFTAKEKGQVTTSDWGELERIKSEEEDIAAGTKNGGDCRASIVLMK